MEWGWRTQFTNLGLVADLGPGTQLKAQALAVTHRWDLRWTARALSTIASGPPLQCSYSLSENSGSPFGRRVSTRIIAAAWSTTNMTKRAGRR